MIYLSPDDRRPLFEQIYGYYAENILKGEIHKGDRLPASRRLAQELGVSRNTVERAYDQLKAEGYVESVQGSGHIVRNIPRLEAAGRGYVLSRPETEDKSPYRYDFVYGTLAGDMFPYTKWLSCVKESIYEAESGERIPYEDGKGDPKLRYEICRYLYEARGVTAEPDQVVVIAGLQYVIEMICDLCAEGGRRFAMEDPGYDGIRPMVRNRGYEILPVAVEDDGISMEALEKTDADLLYLTPSSQFPLGGVLPVDKRMKTIEWAERRNAYIIEDDYYSELRYYTNPIPAMQSMDRYGRVIYTGTFSKSLSPDMRTAYAVLPKELVKRYDERYARYHSHIPGLHERALALFMEKGYYDRHISGVRTAYRRKMDSLINALEQVFGDMVTVHGGEAGIHVIVDVHTDRTQEELITAAEEKGIRVYGTRQFYLNREESPDERLLLGFVTVPETEYMEAFRELKEVWC